MKNYDAYYNNSFKKAKKKHVSISNKYYCLFLMSFLKLTSVRQQVPSDSSDATVSR